MENQQLHSSDWKPGDWLYQCLHGLSQKPQWITPVMWGSINGLKSHLKHEAPLMYNLFEVLERKWEAGLKPEAEELLIASGKCPVNCLQYDLQQQLHQVAESSHLVWCTLFLLPYQFFTQELLQEPFKFDQSNFNHTVTKLIVACDQPFDTTEKFEFKEMMHAMNPRVSLPSAEAVKWCVMGMADDTVSELRTMIAVSDLIPRKTSNHTCQL